MGEDTASRARTILLRMEISFSSSSTLELDSRQGRRMVTKRSKRAQDCASYAVTALLMNFPRSEKQPHHPLVELFSVHHCRCNFTRQQDMLYEARILQKK